MDVYLHSFSMRLMALFLCFFFVSNSFGNASRTTLGNTYSYPGTRKMTKNKETKKKKNNRISNIKSEKGSLPYVHMPLTIKLEAFAIVLCCQLRKAKSKIYITYLGISCLAKIWYPSRISIMSSFKNQATSLTSKKKWRSKL